MEGQVIFLHLHFVAIPLDTKLFLNITGIKNVAKHLMITNTPNIEQQLAILEFPLGNRIQIILALYDILDV